jgi:deoxyhypusine synthase
MSKPTPSAVLAERGRLLSKPVVHIDFTAFDARPILQGMEGMSFTSRDLARAGRILDTMLRDPHCTIILTLAGSTSAGGCMQLYADLIRYNMVDAVVATGASIVDMDFFEGLGFQHYQADPATDDGTLNQLAIDRIYDTYIDEHDLKVCDRVIAEIAATLPPRPHSSREFIQAMGKHLTIHSRKSGSLVELSYVHGVPIFCPAFSDCSAGFGLVKHQIDHPESHLTIDSVKDFRELTELKIKSLQTGLLMIGGGVPKNFVQDVIVCAEFIGHTVEMHKYAIQLTIADVRDGACSSSTLKEANSWGKVDAANEQMVFGEAGSLIPLLASDAFHRQAWQERPRRRLADLFEQKTT